MITEKETTAETEYIALLEASKDIHLKHFLEEFQVLEAKRKR